MKTLLLTLVLLFSISSFTQKKACNKKVNKFKLNRAKKCNFRQKTNVDRRTRVISFKSRKINSHSKYYKKANLSYSRNLLASK